MKSVIAILLIFSSTLLGQEKGLSLKESIAIGLKNSLGIQISESKLKQAEAKEKETGSMFLPRLSAGGTLYWLNNTPLKFDLPPNPLIPAAAEGSLTAYMLNLSLEQPLFTGLRLWSLKNAAALSSKAAAEDWNGAVNETSHQIISAYWTLFKAEKAVDLLKESVKSVQENLNNVRNFEDAGLATRSDYLIIEHQEAELELKLIDAENNFRLANVNFNRVIGINISNESVISPAAEELNLSTYSFDSLYAEALAERSDLKALKYRIGAAEELTSASRADYYPQLSAFGSLYYMKIDAQALPIEKDVKNFWMLGLSAKWSLWNWWGTSAKVTQAEERALQSKLAYDNMAQLVYLEIYRNYLNLKKLKEKLDVLNLSVASATENLRIVKEKFSGQSATSADVLTAESNYLKAKTDYLFLIADFQIAKAELDKSVGRKIYSGYK